MSDTNRSASVIIDMLLSDAPISNIFPNLNDWRPTYREISKIIHPDVCTLPRASVAFQKLSEYKNHLENGVSFRDEAGEVRYTPQYVEFKGDRFLGETSCFNCRKLISLSRVEDENFKKYLPVDIIKSSDTPFTYRFGLPHRAIPLSSVGIVEQGHVNWILSRMLEYSAWLFQNGLSHGGMNPDSIFVIPENHGMICTSFYYLTPLGERVQSISGKWKDMYPYELFIQKTALPSVDVELSKKTAIYLLGDHSGVGTKLKKSHNAEFIDFLISKSPKNPVEIYFEYRELLKAHNNMSEFIVFNK